MFDAMPTNVQKFIHDQAVRGVEMQRKALDWQAEAARMAEKQMQTNIELQRSAYKTTVDAYTAMQQSWIDGLAPTATDAKA